MVLTLELLALRAKAKVRDFLTKENGEVNIVTIVVLIGIAVALALIFKDQIIKLLKTLFATITEQATNAVQPE
ncbi:MAG: Flp1 family type IVb pilin [Lachnospiraceae bacterium]|nr:Flp1 family type IVb pilin [Lachnospiraceae bacterium]